MAEEILSLIRRKGRITIKEIQEATGLTEETTNLITDFLVKFGFAELDNTKRYIRLSKACKPFFEEKSD